MVSINSVNDGTSNTLMIAEAVTGVPWTKPEDLTFTRRSLLPELGGQFKDGFVGVTADGALRLFKNSVDPTLLMEMITRGAGEVIDLSGPVRESTSLKAKSRHPSYAVGSARSASRAARLQHLFHTRPETLP